MPKTPPRTFDGQRVSVRALTRDPAPPAATALPDRVEVVAGDFARPHTLVAALRGVTRMHPGRDGRVRAVLTTGGETLELARQAGVRRVTHHDGSGWVAPDVEQVTGSPGRTFRQWAAEHADDFR
ncbi:hypothetical protein [Micromonospora zamorensis]|uniref:hypothetical protein n=1 Tax=Micromonospora zamorensis TaxID=709883 RepID=UPI0033AFFA8E